MSYKWEDPAARAGAGRANVTVLPGRMDMSDSTPSAIDLQVRRIATSYVISLSLALVIAEIAFSTGKQP